MKKINTKKLNQFYMSGNNAEELKRLVEWCVKNFMEAEVPSFRGVAILQDLGLLTDFLPQGGEKIPSTAI